MPSGPVKWFDQKKGFGFIVGPDGHDVFVHFSVIEGEGYRTLEDGETVEYEIIKGNKGLSAANVRRTRVPSANQEGAAVSSATAARTSAGASAGAMAGAPVAFKAM